MKCAYCEGPIDPDTERQFSIDIDEPTEGDVYICYECGGSPGPPSIEQMQNHIHAVDPLIFAMKVSLGEIVFVKDPRPKELTRFSPLSSRLLPL